MKILLCKEDYGSLDLTRTELEQYIQKTGIPAYNITGRFETEPRFSKIPIKEFRKFERRAKTMKASKELHDLYVISGRTIPRNDATLIEMVEASPDLQERIAILQIPDKVKWEILVDYDYDREFVSEKHRTWHLPEANDNNDDEEYPEVEY